MTDSVFRIKSADILVEGERWDPGETIDLSRIASLVHFVEPVKNPSGQVYYLNFLWDNDLKNSRLSRLHVLYFWNDQDAFMAYQYAKRERDKEDYRLLAEDRVWVRTRKVGRDSPGWIGKIHVADLKKLDYRLNVAEGELVYGAFWSETPLVEEIVNSKLVTAVAEHLGPNKCFNQP